MDSNSLPSGSASKSANLSSYFLSARCLLGLKSSYVNFGLTFLHLGQEQSPEHEGHNQFVRCDAADSHVSPLYFVPKQFLQTILLHCVHGMNSRLYMIKVSVIS